MYELLDAAGATLCDPLLIILLAVMMMPSGGGSSYVFSGKTDDVGFLLLKARAAARKIPCAHRRSAQGAQAFILNGGPPISYAEFFDLSARPDNIPEPIWKDMSGLLSSLVPLGVALRAFFVSSQRQLRGGGAGGRRHSGRWLTPALLPWFLRPSSDWQIRIARGGSWMTCLFVTWRCASSARTSRSPVIFVRAWQRRLATSFGVSLRSRRICSIRLAPPVPLVSAVALSSGCWGFGSCFCGA